MQHITIARILALILPLTCALALPVLAQDSQDTSVAEAARRTREQKKASTKPVTVITNDNLPPAPTPASAATPAAAPDAASAATPGQHFAASTQATDENAPTPAQIAEEKKKEADALKQQVTALQGEVDLAQRSLTLDQEAFYSKPDFSNDKDGKAKLDAEQADLLQKQDDLARLKSKLADLGSVQEPAAPAAPASPSSPSSPASPATPAPPAKP